MQQEDQDSEYPFRRTRSNIADLYGMDARGWRKFDAQIERAADQAMKAVDAETVGLFVKYGIEMPADFARDTRWRKPKPSKTY